MKNSFHYDQICGGVAARGVKFTPDYFANRLDEAFADGSTYEVDIEDVQIWFEFTLIGDPQCPERIEFTTNHLPFVMFDYQDGFKNTEGLSVWGLCQKASLSFFNCLSEFDYMSSVFE